MACWRRPSGSGPGRSRACLFALGAGGSAGWTRRRPRGRAGLPPAAPPIEAAATKQKNDDYDDKKRGHVHGFSFLRQSVSRGILARLAANLTLPAAFLLRPPASVRVRCSRPKFGKRRRRPIGCRAFSLPDKTTSASHPLAVCTGYCAYRTHKYRCNRTYRTAIASIMASPTRTTVRLKTAPQRGHAVALAEIMAPHAGHDVILVMTLRCARYSALDFSCGRCPLVRQASPCATLQTAEAPCARAPWD